MAINSRTKGQRGEYQVRDLFRKYTGEEWERTPQSGALSYLKTDIYVPNCDNTHAIEVKNYEEPILDIKIFTNKSSHFKVFWEKVCEQAAERDQEPLLAFKHSRSKWYLATRNKPEFVEEYIHINWLGCYVMLLEPWLAEETDFIKWSR